MNIFIKYTRKYGDSYGLPFACQLPDMDISSVSFQFGFVGQQPGIGNLLLRYGERENMPEAREKGIGILEFWVKNSMTQSGLPQMCYNPSLQDVYKRQVLVKSQLNACCSCFSYPVELALIPEKPQP